jgi:hypothetical protein
MLTNLFHFSGDVNFSTFADLLAKHKRGSWSIFLSIPSVFRPGKCCKKL